jgi:Zn-dependent oligopeptidase
VTHLSHAIIFYSFSIDGDQVLVTGLYADSPNVMAREVAYRIFLYPDKHQEYLLSEMLSSRHELAQLCGFPTFSHRQVQLVPRGENRDGEVYMIRSFMVLLCTRC